MSRIDRLNEGGSDFGEIEMSVIFRRMEMRDITQETTLLHSYHTVFVGNQRHELLRIYRDHGGKFPVFTDRVFTAAPVTSGSPVDLLDYRTREGMDDADAGRIFILERDDNRRDTGLTRLFFVWASPKQVTKFSSGGPDALRVKVSVIFHPAAGLDKYPAYWQGGIDPVKVPNFLELGARYLCKEKHTVAQHFCAIRPGDKDGVKGKSSSFTGLVVVPVSSAGSFNNLANPRELEEALRHIARRCFEGVTKKIEPASSVTLDRVAVAGYSRSGILLGQLLDNTRSNEPFMRDVLREFYAFDVILDERDRDGKVVKSKQQGYDEFWAKLKKWQGEDADRRIRLYSAEPATVANIYAELRDRLKRYGGGHHNAAVPFSSFNGKPRSGGSGNYAGLTNGYEIYSTDNSRSLVVLPNGNPAVYISTDNIVNPNGFPPGGAYEPELEGHSWFVSRLFTHALFHSGF